MLQTIESINLQVCNVLYSTWAFSSRGRNRSRILLSASVIQWSGLPNSFLIYITKKNS